MFVANQKPVIVKILIYYKCTECRFLQTKYRSRPFVEYKVDIIKEPTKRDEARINLQIVKEIKMTLFDPR